MEDQRATCSEVFEAIGTHWQIDIYEERAQKIERAALFNKIRDCIEEFDRAYSRFRDDSFVSAMARTAGVYTLPPDAKPLMDLYVSLYQATGGAFTPLIGDTLQEAGYDAQYSLRPGKLHAPLAWEEALDYDFPSLEMKKSSMLDFGAAGKGYCVDLIGALLQERGIDSYAIDAGGDMLYRNPAGPLKVGLEHPENPKQVIGVYELAGGSICCSAGNRRAWQGYHHIIDPRTLQSPRDVLSVWATAESALVADAMATALFLVPAAALIPHFDFEYLLMRPDASIERSAGFHAELFTV